MINCIFDSSSLDTEKDKGKNNVKHLESSS